VLILGQSHRQLIHPSPIPIIELLKRPVIAAVDPGDKLIIGALMFMGHEAVLYHKPPPERKVKRAGGSQTVSVWYPVEMGAAWSKVGAERLDESGIVGI